MSLKKQAYRGIKWNTFSTIFTAIGSLIQLYILVRWIEKEDFGLMAIVNVAIAFAMNFLDFGVSSGIVHKLEINSKQLSTLYWITVILGGVLTSIFYISSPFVAAFYDNKELEFLLQLVSIIFLVNGFGGHYRVLLTKELAFDSLAKIKMASFMVSFLVVVLLAYEGYGVLSLVAGTLMKAILETMLCIGIGRKLFRLEWCFDISEVQFFLKFGYFQMGERLLNFFNKQIDVILIGKFLGVEILGVYDVIKRLLSRPIQLINPIITEVTFPVMAKVQDDIGYLRKIYLKQLNYVCSLNFPIYFFLFFNAANIIQLMFGSDWILHQNIFQVLCLYFVLYTTGHPVGSLLLAKGRADIGFYWNLGTFLLIPLGILIGVGWGLLGVAVILVLLQIALVIPNFLLQVKPMIFVKGKSYFYEIVRPLLLATLMGSCTMIMNLYPFNYLVVSIASSLVFGGIVYFILSLRFNPAFILDLKKVLKV